MFGSYGVWSRLIGNSFGVFYQGWTRTLLIALILFPIVLYKKEIIPIQKKDWKWMSVFLISTSLTQAPIFYAFNHMDIGTATLLFFVGMIMTMYLFGFAFLEERATKIKILSFVIACIGLYITFSFSLVAFSILAASMAVLNGIATGVELSSSKKLTGSYSPLYVTWLSWVVIAVTNFIASVGIREIQHVPTFTLPWLYLVVYAVVSILGFWFAIDGYKYVEASVGGLLALLEVVFAVFFGITIFHQGLTLKVVFGGVLILLAAALPHITNKNKTEYMNINKKEMLKLINENGGTIIFQTLVERIRKNVGNNEYAPHLEIRELRRDGYIATENIHEYIDPQQTIAITEKGCDALLPYWQQKALWNKLRNPATIIIGIATIISAIVAIISYLYPHK